MIRSFKCKETEKIWQGIKSRKFPPEIQNRALVKLRQLDVSFTLEDLRIPPSNHLESLKGDRKTQMSIRITKQWRICFAWELGEALDVEIIDYH
ncbi:MAG: type II toxin-antitoxin system RelE/ParE family toxin [Alphaproteobacteria bacterium]|nr:type II toxin-antitoxin system RelE/ParE family toxin [Alphaproteobacteria bacterium]